MSMMNRGMALLKKTRMLPSQWGKEMREAFAGMGIEQQRKTLAKPRGLGGYELVKLMDAVLLDKRQKHGVPLFYAKLIHRSRYFPHQGGGRRRA